MKMSLCQLIAIACTLAVGFITITPFVQTADADGYAHYYTVPADVVEVGVCEVCGSHIYYKSLNQIQPMSLFHNDFGAHAVSATAYLYVTKDAEVCSCSWS